MPSFEVLNADELKKIFGYEYKNCWNKQETNGKQQLLLLCILYLAWT